LKLGISPAVLADNFVMQASSFMKTNTIESEPVVVGYESEPVVVGYWVQKQGAIQDAWLLAKRGGMKLVLLSCPSKNANDDLLEKLLTDVIAVLKDFFPVVVKRHTEQENRPVTSNSGMELTAALQRAQKLREQGALRKVSKVRVPEVVEPMPVVSGTLVKTKMRLNPSMTLFLKCLVVVASLYFLRAYLSPFIPWH
jgi:hypothetical protein